MSAATIALGQSAIATGSEFEQLMARLKTTLGSQGAAEAAFKTIQQFSATTPFQVSEVTEAFISLHNRGIGFSPVSRDSSFATRELESNDVDHNPLT